MGIKLIRAGVFMLLGRKKISLLRVPVALLAYGICALLALGGAGLAQSASSGGQSVPPPQTFGAWTKVCSLPPGTPTQQCELMQSARARDRPDISFRISFIKREQPERLTILRAIVPINVELQLGIGIMIDGTQDMGKMPYRRCLGDECVAEVMLGDQDLQTFFSGKTATFYVFTTPEDGVGGVINLDGVRAGYEDLP